MSDKPKKPEFKYSKRKLEGLIQGIYDGDVTARDLPEDLYTEISRYLRDGLYKGFGQTLDEAEGADLRLLSELRENIFHFSAAKTYQQVKEMNEALIGDNDTVVPFADFKAAAEDIFLRYNGDPEDFDKHGGYLETEYDTTIASGQMGAKWNDIEEKRDTLPYLKLSVVEDENTSEICEPLDGICRPIDDEFWSIYYPPLHWKCRTTVLQLDKIDGEAQVSDDGQVKRGTDHADEHMQDMFKMNVGKNEVVFNKEHPYFDVPKADRKFASRNFDLPLPSTD